MPKPPNKQLTVSVVCTDAIIGLDTLEGGFDLVIADPPYNQGVDYGEGSPRDKMPSPLYLKWCRQWLWQCTQLISPTGTLWIVISDEWAAEFVVYLKKLGLYQRNWVKWYETFGNNCTTKFNRTSRHLLYFVKDKSNFTFNPTPVRVPSDRLLKYKDKRANPAGKLMDDVWCIPRVAGTHKERCKWAPTQLPLELISNIVKACSNPGDLVLDPFFGTGTTGVACKQLNRRCIGLESSLTYCIKAKDRIRLAKPAPTVYGRN